ncbi:hypothetical protein D9758_010263 [Tetrapyrgos nigripes]|uniref:Uncharacterized protein n=1 Tax=Tetrapyrgos nigripes TaxID=182062 RepID=A0A8H5GAM9_9AGAR|nr:hypothetical protein D9758_010263 [Tetrapyrgos nigripes]
MRLPWNGLPYLKKSGSISAKFIFLSLITPTLAQSFSPSSSWRKPFITNSPADQVDKAGAALASALRVLNPETAQYSMFTFQFVARFENIDFGLITGVLLSDNSNFLEPGTLFYEMARFDYLTGQTKYQEQLEAYFSKVINKNPHFSHPRFILVSLPHALIYGYAAIQAFRAYKDNIFLTYAESSWAFGWNYTISQEQADSRHTPVKNLTFADSNLCARASLAGGTFRDTDTRSGLVTAAATGLSAALAEATNNQAYLGAAKLSFQFISKQLISPDRLVETAMDATNCDPVVVFAYPYNSGFFLEGLSMLNGSTPPDEAQLLPDMVLAATTTTKSVWNTEQGIIQSTADPGAGFAIGSGGDSQLVRGLTSVFERTNKSDLRSYVKSYLAVQLLPQTIYNVFTIESCTLSH